MTAVRARVPTPGGSRRAHLREWRRESLWLWPAIAAIGAWVAGDIAARYLHSFTLHQGLFPTNLDDARTLLATIATALLTFTGVVFSITLVALQMSSTQYSPRVLRTFVRKPITKLALSTFIATFVYSLTLLARVGTTTGAHTVPQGAVGLAYLLVMASVLVFVVFVHSTVRSMRVSYVIQAVFNETLEAIHAMFAPAASYHEVPEPAFGAAPVLVSFDRGGCGHRRCGHPSPGGGGPPARMRVAALRPGRHLHGARLGSHGGARRHGPGDGAAPRRAGLLRGPFSLPGPVLRRPAARRHRDPCGVGGHQRPDDRRPDARPAARDPASHRGPPRPLGRLPRRGWRRPPGGAGARLEPGVRPCLHRDLALRGGRSADLTQADIDLRRSVLVRHAGPACRDRLAAPAGSATRWRAVTA